MQVCCTPVRPHGVYSKEEIICKNGFLKPSAHRTILSLATEILSSVISDEKEFLTYLILKMVVSDKNLL